MIHYTCDRCKRLIDPLEHTRHVVQIDIQTTTEQPGYEIDDEIDHLSVLHHSLEDESTSLTNDALIQQDCECGGHHGRYDLCDECFAQLLKNPLGRDSSLALGFSNN